jgi:hypothetical protein
MIGILTPCVRPTCAGPLAAGAWILGAATVVETPPLASVCAALVTPLVAVVVGSW